MYTNAHRAVRALRLQRGWSQSALGGRAGVSRQVVSRVERGDAAGLTLSGLDRIAGALGASVHLQVRWRGEELDRLMDAYHAALQQAVAAQLLGEGWQVRVEVSFNHYGDRGRVDVMALHQERLLLVVEVKSALGDVQETLGRLDVKTRLGRHIAADLGWDQVAGVVPVLVIGDAKPARRTVAGHAALFARYDLRGRAAWAWLRRPTGPMPTGLLWFAKRPNSHGVVVRRGQRAPRALGEAASAPRAHLV